MAVDREEMKRKAAKAIDKATEAEVERASRDKVYAHDWLQTVIGWITGLVQVISDASRGCHISTALVHHLGLPDDCEQLQTLRQFRDEYALNSGVKQYLEDLQNYYCYAPYLIDWIEQRSDSDRIWKNIEQSVNSVIQSIVEKRYDEAYQIYKANILGLKMSVILQD